MPREKPSLLSRSMANLGVLGRVGGNHSKEGSLFHKEYWGALDNLEVCAHLLISCIHGNIGD